MRLDHSTISSHWQAPTGANPAHRDFFAQALLQDFSSTLALSGIKDPRVWTALQKEPNTEILFHSLLALSADLEKKQAPEASLRILSALADADPEKFPISPELREKIQAHRQALGTGNGGFELCLNRFVGDATSPALVLGMTGANLLGRLTFGSLLTRLSARPASVLARPLIARGLAGAGALALEAPAFTVLSRGAQKLFGKHGDETPLGDAMRASFLMMGAFKLSGALSRQGLKSFARALPTLPRPALGALTHAAGFGGILAGQEIFRQFNTETATADRFGEALTFWLHSQIGGHISSKLLGKQLSAALAQIENSAGTKRPNSGFEEIFQPRPALAASGPPTFPHLLMSSGGPRNPSWSWIPSLPGKIQIDVKKSSPRLLVNRPLTVRQLGELMDTAKAIEPSLFKVEALTRLAGELKQNGDDKQFSQLLRQAEKIIGRIPQPLQRVVAWGRIALAQQLFGDAGDAANLFARTLEESAKLEFSPFDREALLKSWDHYLQWVAELHTTGPSPHLERVFQFSHELQKRLFPLSQTDELLHHVAIRSSKIGDHPTALNLAASIESDLGLETRLRIARYLVEHGERKSARNLLHIIDGAVDVAELKADLALDYLRTMQVDRFRAELGRIQQPFVLIETLLKGAAMSAALGKKFQAIEWAVEAQTYFEKAERKLSSSQRIRLRARFARLTVKQDQSELAHYHLDRALGELRGYGIQAIGRTPELQQAFGETGLAVVQLFGEKITNEFFRGASADSLVELQRFIALSLGEEKSVEDAQIWAALVRNSDRGAVQRDLVLTFHRVGMLDAALELAERIVDPAARFEALFAIYHAKGADTPPPSSVPPAPGSTPPSGSSPGGLMGFLRKYLTAPPSVNARSLGSDGPVSVRPSLILEPDPDLVKAVPYFLLAGKPKAESGPEPLLLQLELPSSVSPRPGAVEILAAGSRVPAKPSQTPPSDPPPSFGFTQEATDWVRKQSLGINEVRLVEALLDKIYRQVWEVLNYQSGNRAAHRIAAGKEITLQIIPKNSGLTDYDIEILDAPKAPQSEFNLVQLSFNPATGELKPLPYADHNDYEQKAVAQGISLWRFFIPFYRRIDLVSPALRASQIIPHLPLPIQQMIAEDPTIYRKPEASPKPERGTYLATYRPVIFEGTVHEVDRYAEYQGMPDAGRRHLHKLTQHILAALYERETKIDLKENVSLKNSPGINVLIDLDPEEPGQMKVQVLTMQETFRHTQHGLGPNQVMLYLLRYAPMGGGEAYPHLHHHYRGPNQMPTPADLLFQNYLGLSGPLHMRWDMMNHRPSEEFLRACEEWMVLNGYFEETMVELNPVKK